MGFIGKVLSPVINSLHGRHTGLWGLLTLRLTTRPLYLRRSTRQGAVFYGRTHKKALLFTMKHMGWRRLGNPWV